MNRKACLTAAWVGLVVVGGARGQFKAGHVFVTDPTSHQCDHTEFYTWDRIWEIDPKTGEVTLFAELQDELCGGVFGAAFTPDGKRLRVGQFLTTSRILEFDWQGNVRIALDFDDGVRGPEHILYDADGNFYVSNVDSTIVRFPVDGGPGTIFADASDGINGSGPMAFTARYSQMLWIRI